MKLSVRFLYAQKESMAYEEATTSDQGMEDQSGENDY